ncbi:hypothetical protein F5887DRAFT_566849 [Amanita rubescens]|nr:hypothetical protein F5887DRAFT_566849 [Amanita rubescens]
MSTSAHMHNADILWIILVSIMFLLLFSHLGGPDKVSKPRTPPPAVLAKFRATQFLKEKDRHSRLKFPKFTELPDELQLHILSYASSRQTFLALALTSKDIRRITFLACLPRIPILLTTREKLISFDRFCVNNPEDTYFPGVARVVRHLWISPYEAEDRLPSSRVLKRCLNVNWLACNVWLLREGVLSQDELEHQQCRFLTLLKPSEEKWDSNIPPQMQRSCGAFFKQLTRLQVEADVLVPRRILCDNITHLSFACAPGWKKEGALGLMKLVKDVKRYPRLEKVVVTQRKPDEKVDIVGDSEASPRIVTHGAPGDAVDVKHWDVDEGVDVWERAEKALRRVTSSDSTST